MLVVRFVTKSYLNGESLMGIYNALHLYQTSKRGGIKKLDKVRDFGYPARDRLQAPLNSAISKIDAAWASIIIKAMLAGIASGHTDRHLAV